MVFDVLLLNGRVVDGSGSPALETDVGIEGDKIAFVGRAAGLKAHTTFDVRGLVVSPGFIDIHSHTDQALLDEPPQQSKLQQGVTTEVGGNCGNSAFPWVASNFFRREGDTYPWHTFDDFATALEANGLLVNYGSLVGYGSLHDFVASGSHACPQSNVFGAVRSLLEQNLDQGALGLSTGMPYPPCSRVTPAELHELCRIVARYGGVYASHIRSEGEGVVEAVGEILDLGAATGVSVQVSHLKTWGQANWPKIDRVLELIGEANLRGVRATADRYPYVAGGTFLDYALPVSVRDGGPELIRSNLNDHAARRAIEVQVVQEYGDLQVVCVPRSTVERLFPGSVDGLQPVPSIPELADRVFHTSPFDALVRMILAGLSARTQVYAFFFMMSEENLATIVLSPHVMVGSDADPYIGERHPRYRGCFPRVLAQLVREKNVLRMEEAVRKMTSMPAEKVGLDRRGLLHEGYYADVVAFDPLTVGDTATYADPMRFPVGIEYVFVNGELALKHGRVSERRAGRVLRRQ